MNDNGNNYINTQTPEQSQPQKPVDEKAQKRYTSLTSLIKVFTALIIIIAIVLLLGSIFLIGFTGSISGGSINLGTLLTAVFWIIAVGIALPLFVSNKLLVNLDKKYNIHNHVGKTSDFVQSSADNLKAVVIGLTIGLVICTIVITLIAGLMAE